MAQSRILRCFVKPAGAQWLDLPLGPTMTVEQVFAIMKNEGSLVSSYFILPFESVLYAGVLTLEDGRPHLSVVPGPWNDKPEPPKGDA